MYLNEATLLDNVRARYDKDLIYVRIFSLFCRVFIDVEANRRALLIYILEEFHIQSEIFAEFQAYY